jgi:general secretion pathway protein F
MTPFAATYIDGAGRRRRDRFIAGSEEQVRQDLRARALWPVSVRALPADRSLARLTVPSADFIPFLHQLELQLRAGVTADVALAHLAEETPKGKLRSLVEHLHREVARGRPIHDACRALRRQFPEHHAAVIEAGELSAQLPEALRALAAHLSSVEELGRSTRRALLYPGMVLTATGGLVGFLLGGVVPQFAEVFTSLSLRLPALTEALIATSAWTRAHAPLIAVAAVSAVLLAAAFARSARLRLTRDHLLDRVPLLGDTLRLLATARFAAHCRLLHDAGVPLLEALRTGASLAGHAILSANLEAARRAVALGQPLHRALPKGHAFPSFFIPAVRAGETTGQLGPALRHVEDYATRRARDRIASALALFEPVILTVLAGIVGTIALSFFLPLLSLLGGVASR